MGIYKPDQLINPNISLVKILMFIVFGLLLLWYVKYLWSRRNLYLLANRIHGPTALPIVGSLYLLIGGPKTILKTLFKIDKRYPKLAKFWFGNRLFLLVSEPKYLETIVNNPNALAKENFIYDFGHGLVGKGLVTAPVHTWKRNRKMMNPAFNLKILGTFVKVFAVQSQILAESFKKKFSGKGEFDVLNVVHKCSLDMICETIMGVNVNAQTTDSEYLQWVDRIFQILFKRIVTVWYHLDFIFNMTQMNREQMDIVKKIHKFNDKIITYKRIKFEEKLKTKHESIVNKNNADFDGRKRKDFLDLLMELSHDGYQFTDRELRDEVNTFVVAGSDTSAITISFLLTLLGMHPDVQQKVYKEVIDVVGPTRTIENTDLPNLKYTEMVIKETLRLFPVGPLVLRRISEDIDLGDVMLPKNSTAVICAILVHRNPKYWPDPLKFDPNRFLPEEVVKREPCSYIPFVSGPRNCIGQTYAMMAMKVMTAYIVRNFEIFSSYKRIEDIELMSDILLRPIKGFKVSVESRN